MNHYLNVWTKEIWSNKGECSPISIEVLLVLDAIEYRGSYAVAAEQLNKVPSALSYIVQKLEEQLNVTLFVWSARRAMLTSVGKHLLVEGRKVLHALNLNYISRHPQ